MKWRQAMPVVSRVIHWLLVIILLIYLITGLDIAYYQVMQVVTFGLLSKATATKIHDALLIPFVVLLLLHVAAVIAGAGRRKQSSNL
jgi:cytochrome b subunit of formate dehydrogenase